MTILEGNCTEQDKVKLETDDAVEDAALEAEEADCKEKIEGRLAFIQLNRVEFG